jgi:basic membrane lipoprotein Med (substrate-binding protein (PBP1-ABC) superfamily)
MSSRSKKLSTLLVVSGLVLAACGGDDDAPAAEPTADETDESTADVPEETSDDMSDEVSAEPSAEPTEEPSAEPTEEPSDEVSEEAPETDEIVAAFDANGDGTVTIGVAAAGPRDDNGYYQSLVDFAETFSAENGFATPIVSDNIGAEEAAQAMSDLAQQGVDIMFVGASEIAEPLPDLTEAFPDIFWYCNCGAGFAELPGLAQATDWGAAIHYTAGVAMGQTMVEQSSTQSVFLGCCDLNFEREAYNATVAGMQSVDESLTMEYVATGDFPFDFDNSGNATAALTNAQANGATLAYAYLGGALEPVGQLATEQGLEVFAAGPADICERDDGIDWTGSIVFDGGLYAAQALRLIIAGELGEGSTYQFPTEQGLNGAVLCAPSADAEAALADAFGLLASFDEDLMGQLGAISGEAYSGG